MKHKIGSQYRAKIDHKGVEVGQVLTLTYVLGIDGKTHLGFDTGFCTLDSCTVEPLDNNDWVPVRSKPAGVTIEDELELLHRDGTVLSIRDRGIGRTEWDYMWKHCGQDSDIMAYRIVTPKPRKHDDIEQLNLAFAKLHEAHAKLHAAQAEFKSAKAVINQRLGHDFKVVPTPFRRFDRDVE